MAALTVPRSRYRCYRFVHQTFVEFIKDEDAHDFGVRGDHAGLAAAVPVALLTGAGAEFRFPG